MPAVRDTPEYRRVRDLQRRHLTERDGVAWAKVLTPYYRRPGSLAALNPWQALTLVEADANRGAYVGLPVGFGKTLPTHLLPTVLDATRAVMIVPGVSLVAKSYDEFAALSKDWVAPRTPTRVMTLQSLSLQSGRDIFSEIGPDLVMIDECDDAANTDSAAVQFLDMYKVANQAVPYVCLTGSPTRWTPMDFWHHLCWCLMDRAPVPRTELEAREWSQVIAEPRTNRGGWSRMRPGVLGETREAAREWFSDRLVQTPGVILVDGDSCDQELTIRVRPAQEDPILDRAYERFLKTLRSPNDEKSVADPLSRWQLDGQLGCGLYLRYNPAPPQEWRDARRALDKFVREAISNSRRSGRVLFTEGNVLRRFEDHETVKAWQRVRHMFDPQRSSEAVWLTDSGIQTARTWLAESPEPGIVWCGSIEFAEALADATRLPYYGEKGTERRSGRGLHNADPASHLIASWHANKKGFNLQPWARQALFMPPQSAKWLEQIFGRSHRQGQTRGVHVDVFATSGGTYDLFDTAILEATSGRATTTLTQKILRAKIERVWPRETRSNRFRWATREERGEHAD